LAVSYSDHPEKTAATQKSLTLVPSFAAKEEEIIYCIARSMETVRQTADAKVGCVCRSATDFKAARDSHYQTQFVLIAGPEKQPQRKCCCISTWRYCEENIPNPSVLSPLQWKAKRIV
jgi:hypothetical protein